MKKRLYSIFSIFLLAVFTFGLVGPTQNFKTVSAASGGRIYIDPSQATYTVNGTFSVRVRVSSPSPINAVFVHIYYNGRGLQFISAQRGSGFPNQNAPTTHQAGDTGHIYMESTRNNAQAGDFHFATITFKATATGTWGVRPGTNSTIINYPSNTVSYTIGRADYTITNSSKPQPPTPSNPTPNPTPTPTPSRPSSPSGNRNQPSNTAPSSETSDSGMQITDVIVTDQSYRKALIGWNTTKPTSSKINYGTSADNLSEEIVKDEPSTGHGIILEGDALKAGQHYYVRITADDGSGPVTVDTEFDTKPIPVVVKVNNEKDEPIADASVQVNDLEATTNQNGEVTLELPEGIVTIFAQKDELSREVSENIEVPADETNPQRITLSLTKAAAPTKVTVPKKKSTSPLVIILPIVLLTGGVVAFLLWRRKNKKQSIPLYGDPLEAENYTNNVIPSTPVEPPAEVPKIEPEITESPSEVTDLPAPPPPPMPEPRYLPIENPSIPHHASLPELVGRYGVAANSSKAEIDTHMTTELPTTNTVTPHQTGLSPTGQEIPKHTSLKDLVATPQAKQTESTFEAPADDLPASPVAPEALRQADSNLSDESKEKKLGDGSLVIEH